jgi:hypothetical protein
MSNGKGSKRRPPSVPPEVFEENWNAVFKKKAARPTTPEATGVVQFIKKHDGLFSRLAEKGINK